MKQPQPPEPKTYIRLVFEFLYDFVSEYLLGFLKKPYLQYKTCIWTFVLCPLFFTVFATHWGLIEPRKGSASALAIMVLIAFIWFCLDPEARKRPLRKV